MRRLDRAALVGMHRALQAAGLFASPEDGHRLEEIVDATGAAARHHRLLRRWLAVLTAEGLLERDAQGAYRTREPLSAADAEAAWAAVDELQREDLYPAALIGYFRTSTDRLLDLLRDDSTRCPCCSRRVT